MTGAAGFAGGHLVEYLAAQQAARLAARSFAHDGAPDRVTPDDAGRDETEADEIVAWARSEPPTPLASLARWERVDLLNRDRVRSAIAALRPTAVFHCAGIAHVAQSWTDTATPLAGNVLATHHLLDAIRRSETPLGTSGQPCRVLVTGSATVYAPSDRPIPEDGAIAPGSPYALSKLAQEQLSLRALREDGIDVILARSFNHTGPRQVPAYAAPSFAQQVARIERGECEAIIRVGNLDARRDFTDVRDVVRAYAALMDAGVPGTIYNVASGEGRSIRSVLDALVARANVRVRIELDERLLRPQDTPALVGDISRLTKATGWRREISFERIIDDLLAHWRGQASSAS